MTRKNLNTSQLVNELHGASAFFQRPTPVSDAPSSPPAVNKQQSTRETPPKVTRKRTYPRQNTRQKSRENTRHLPTRDEIQEFSFRLRDEYKVKVQAEVPPQWQEELEEVARKLKVKKLELYRYIFGEFLGKVRRQNQS